MRMRTVARDMGTPNIPPMGLGCLLIPFGETTVLSMSGTSPGGTAMMAVVPEHDLVFVAFGNDGRAMPLHNRLMLGVLRQHLGVEVPALVSETSPVPDLERYAGTFRSNQLRIDVSVVDGGLEERTSYEPQDASQERTFSAFVGGTTSAPPRRLVPVREDLFAPAGMPLQAFDGYSRQMLVSYHGAGAGSDRPGYRCAGGRMTRRADA